MCLKGEQRVNAKPSETGFAEVNGARLYYEVAGAGHPLTLIHAGIADHQMWDDQFAAFAARCRVIRYDLRGFGQSTLPPGPYSMVDDLRALLATLGVERTYLLGCSMGGGIVIDFTLTHPDHVDALILVGSAISGRESSQGMRDAWAAVDATFERDGLDAANDLEVRIWVDGPHRTPDQAPSAVRERVRAMNRRIFERGPEFDATEGQKIAPPAAGRLSEIHAPTLVIVGDGDQPDIVANAEYLTHGPTSIPSTREVIMPGLGHVPNMEQPAEFNRIVLDFLAQIGG